MKVVVMSVMVDDQEKALKFYTGVLGFVKKRDVDMGGGARWLTVVSPDQPGGTEILLEPDGLPAAKTFKKAIVSDGIPWTSFGTDDLAKEVERLKKKGVKFTQEPARMGPVSIAVFDDTCGNLIQIGQEH